MTIQTDIRDALEAQAVTVTGFPDAANRAWDNVAFKSTTGTTWARLSIFPVMTRPAVRGASPQLRYDGLFQVSLFAPVNTGPHTVEALADAVLGAFTVDEVLTKGTTNVRFNYAERNPALVDQPWYQVPITVSWYSYK